MKHDEVSGGPKQSKQNPIDPERSTERSWIQARTVELILARFPDGNSFKFADWIKAYKQSEQEWKEADGSMVSPR